MDITCRKLSSSKFKSQCSRNIIYNPFSVFGSLVIKDLSINTFPYMPIKESNGGICRNGDPLPSVFYKSSDIRKHQLFSFI